MLNGLAKLSFPTMAGDSTLRELTVVSAGGGGAGQGGRGAQHRLAECRASSPGGASCWA